MAEDQQHPSFACVAVDTVPQLSEARPHIREAGTGYGFSAVQTAVWTSQTTQAKDSAQGL